MAESSMSGATFGTVKSYYKNQVIFKQDQPGNVGYVIRTGQVMIYKMIDGKKKIISTLGPGEVLGEMGLVSQTSRTAYAQAVEYCELVMIDKETLHAMLIESPKLIQSILLCLINRLSSTLDMLNVEQKSGTIEKKTMLSQLLCLMASYDQEIDYLLFCRKAMAITGTDQKAMDHILQQLINKRAIEIVKHDQNNSGWAIRNIDIRQLT
jgi:CRP-like cAMP-binding protein